MDWKLELVIVPVRDVDRAKAFYADQVGFGVDHDTAVSDTVRIVQLTPPGSACSISLSLASPEAQASGDVGPPGSLRGTVLVVDDVEVARDELLARGVDVTPVRHFDGTGFADGRGGRWNSFVFFDDPDGNGWVVQERPGAE